MFIRFLIIVAISSYSLFAQEEKKSDPQNIAQISEAFGHLIGKNMDTIGVNFKLEAVIKGLQDAANGKESPLSETECIEAISAAQIKARQEQAELNLKLAEKFLHKNANEEGVVCLEEGKVQYKVEKQGNGAVVQANSTPVIRYVGKYLDGSVFGASKKDEPLSLEETIQGFRKGLVGMKEGEKRTLYIHPEYGYGTQGYLPPNSLLTFEIEIVKATSPEKQEDLLTTEPSKESQTKEADLDPKAVR